MAPHRRTRLGLARSFQLPRPFPSLSVADNIRIPLLFASSGAMHTEAGLRRSCIEQLEHVGLAGKADAFPADLTQIDMRKLELARAMTSRPKLLIADEAMAGLSHSEVDEILALLFRLNAEGTTLVLIEHIMRAVMAFSQRLVCFVAGNKIADGPPAEVIRLPEVERAYLGE
jgi:branched-chain amino acid transport system ATP-binding protein